MRTREHILKGCLLCGGSVIVFCCVCVCACVCCSLRQRRTHCARVSNLSSMWCYFSSSARYNTHDACVILPPLCIVFLSLSLSLFLFVHVSHSFSSSPISCSKRSPICPLSRVRNIFCNTCGSTFHRRACRATLARDRLNFYM